MHSIDLILADIVSVLLILLSPRMVTFDLTLGNFPFSSIFVAL